MFLINTKNKLSADCVVNKKRISEVQNIKLIEINEDLPDIEIQPDNVIIDGLFGSGLNKPIEEKVFSDIIRLMNSSSAKIYSIDIPSGLFGEDNDHNILENVVKATKTFAFQSPKLAFLFPDSTSESCSSSRVQITEKFS